MENAINKDSLRLFAYVNDGALASPVKGVVLDFLGLGNMTVFGSDTLEGEYFGERGILYVVPYTNPWSWMNSAAVEYTDEIVDVLFDKFALYPRTPIVSSGRSMGGLSALVYTAYAKRTPVACVANCPVCDALFHYTERPDLPRTMYAAVGGKNRSLEEGLKSVSPVHLIVAMPKETQYHIFHCANDGAVNIARHSDVFVKLMREAGRAVTYDVIAGRDHCDLGLSGKRKYAQYIVDAVNRT